MRRMFAVISVLVIFSGCTSATPPTVPAPTDTPRPTVTPLGQGPVIAPQIVVVTRKVEVTRLVPVTVIPQPPPPSKPAPPTDPFSPTSAPVAAPAVAALPPPTAAPQPTAAPAVPAGDAPGAPPRTKIGISMSDFTTERWAREVDQMTQLLQYKGYDVVVQAANHDVQLQNGQIDDMVTQDVKGLIVVAEDSDAVVPAVQKATQAGVRVIAYDRLINDPSIAAYLSFDNVAVGRNQADGVMKALFANYDVSKGPAKVVMLGGSPTDNSAILARMGQSEIVAQYVNDGRIQIVADQWVNQWNAADALKLMENILVAQKNQIDAVIASNDETALGALQALKAQGLAGKVPISGQGATADGCNSIVKGELTVSILKDIRSLAPTAVNLLDNLLRGQTNPNLKSFTMAELTNNPGIQGTVQAYFFPIRQVNKDNVYNLCVQNGFQNYDAVYRDIPESQRPPRP